MSTDHHGENCGDGSSLCTLNNLLCKYPDCPKGHKEERGDSANAAYNFYRAEDAVREKYENVETDRSR